jgi:2-epi-valiolone-7-phosphate 1-reductase
VNLSDAITPVCGPNDVMVSLRYVGLCGTDIQLYRGAQEGVANVLGHEGVGVITEVGASVRNWSLGDAVVFNPVSPAQKDEILGRSFDGLFQERFLVERADWMDWLIHRIPKSLVKPIGALIEPLATAIYSRDLAISQSDARKAVVIGDGPIAMLNSIVLRLSGFESVLMIHGRSTRRSWAVNNGYFSQFDVISGRGNVVGNVLERLNGEFADVAIICSPGETVERATLDAFGYLKSSGLINFVSNAVPAVISLNSGDLNVRELQHRSSRGIPSHGVLQRFESTNGKFVKVHGQHGVSAAHIQESIDLLVENPLPFKNLITDVVGFDDSPAAVSSAIEWSLGRMTGDRPMKVVVELNKQNSIR